ncbi:MAG: hypothetical protein AAFY42_05700 [Pseudomonadota bacterium]
MQEINPALFSAFANDQERAFAYKLADVVKQAVPDLASQPDDAFLAQIRLLIEEARSYGLFAERTIGVFAITAGLLGLNFVEDHPAAKDILTSHDSEFDKASMLEEFTVQLFRALDQ